MRHKFRSGEREGCSDGWDGDDLAGSMEDAYERQQEAAEARRAAAKKSAPGDRERSEREESLRLNRARLSEQLGRATNSAHRAMLERRSMRWTRATSPHNLGPGRGRLMPREVTDDQGVTWVCAQAYAGLAPEGEAQGAAAGDGGAGGEGGPFDVVCTPGGGEQTVRLRLPAGWDESYPDESLLREIDRARRSR